MRTLLTLSCATLLVAWADAQQAGAMLTAADRLKQLQSNRGLVEKMVGHSLLLSKANDSVARTAACRAAMGELAVALDGAIDAKDANRVAELGDHLIAIVNDGLLPTMHDAKGQVPKDSAEEAKLIDLHAQATQELTRLESSVPRMEALGRSNQVKETLAKLQSTRDQLAMLFSVLPQPMNP